jgi:hypothetical protein
MKKTLIGLIAIGCIAFTSCKKDYTCSCKGKITQEAKDPSTGEVDDFFSSEQVIDHSVTINDKKKDAEAKCSEGDQSTTSTSSLGGLEVTQKANVTCTLSKK